MGTFVFKWEHPAQEVYVTGTFDDWSKSEKLEKVGDIFVKDVTLPSAAEKIYYKFVVDGNWTTDHTAPQENDASGNLNNVLTTERIKKHTPATAGIMSTVGPSATTAGLAKDVPLEKAPLEHTGSSDLPGAFPETPAATEKGDFSVNPLPAFDGAVNPVKLAPGEKVPDPSTLTHNTITSNVKDDPELVAADKAKGAGTYDASPMIQSAGAGTTTAALAGAVPLESTKVPEVVKESQAEAGVAPEASGVPEEVKEKSAVEKELLSEVKEAPATSEGTGGKATADKSEKSVTAGETAAAVGGAAVAIGGAAAAYASGAASKLPDSVTSKLPTSVQNSINSTNATSTSQSTATAKDTPAVVKESIAESGQAPEAAGNEEAVLEKKAVEKELLSEIKPETATGEPAPKIGGLSTPKAAEPIESRDVSPGTVPGAHTQNQTVPTVTSGVTSGATAPVTPAKDAPATPAKSTPGSSKVDSPAASATTDKKNKRRSFFGKIKDKLSSKDK